MPSFLPDLLFLTYLRGSSLQTLSPRIAAPRCVSEGMRWRLRCSLHSWKNNSSYSLLTSEMEQNSPRAEFQVQLRSQLEPELFGSGLWKRHRGSAEVCQRSTVKQERPLAAQGHLCPTWNGPEVPITWQSSTRHTVTDQATHLHRSCSFYPVNTKLFLLNKTQSFECF